MRALTEMWVEIPHRVHCSLPVECPWDYIGLCSHKFCRQVPLTTQ